MTSDAIFAIEFDPMSDRRFSKEWFGAQFERTGKTQAGLYHFMNGRFGLDRTKVNKMVNGRRRPQPEELTDLLAWFDEKGNEVVVDLERERLPKGNEVTITGVSNFPDTGPRDVPVHQIAVGGSDGDFIFSDGPMDYVRRPPSLSGQKVIAAFVTSDSMYPKYEPGEPVYAYKSRVAVAGDYVIVELYPADEFGEKQGYIKKFVKRTAEVLICEQYNPPKSIEFPSRRVANVYRIVSNKELLG